MCRIGINGMHQGASYASKEALCGFVVRSRFGVSRRCIGRMQRIDEVEVVLVPDEKAEGCFALGLRS